jgi:hypothetical protein
MLLLYTWLVKLGWSDSEWTSETVNLSNILVWLISVNGVTSEANHLPFCPPSMLAGISKERLSGENYSWIVWKQNILKAFLLSLIAFSI